MESSERYCYRPSLNWDPQLEQYFIEAYGADRFRRISKSLTEPSCYSCIRVNTIRSTSDSVLQKLLGILQETRQHNVDPPKSNGTIPILKCQIPGLDYVLLVSGSGPHLVEYGHQLGPERPVKEVIVSRKCAESVLRGAQVYVPGVLACSAHVEKGDTVAVSVAIEQPCENGGWAVGITRGIVLQGLHSDPHYFERRGMYIGRGTAMLTRAGIFRESSGVAVDMNDRVFDLPSFNDVLKGDIFLQNLPSIITAHVLDPQPGERILDMCAAPGGKTTAIATLMKDQGEVIAVDRSHNKVIDIQNLAAELGLNCISTCKLNSLKAVRNGEFNDIKKLSIEDAVSPRIHMEKLTSTIEGSEAMLPCNKNVSKEKSGGGYVSRAEERKRIRRLKNGPGRNFSVGGRVEKSEGFFPNSFDRVLLDAPCSALGLRPRLFVGEETVESLRKHATYQRRMFDQAVQLVRSGGVIVYSTCTINPGENEALVRYALDTYKFLSLASQNPRVGGPGILGRHESSDGYVEEWLKPGEENLVQRFDPSSPLDTIGFFIAKFCVGSKDV